MFFLKHGVHGKRVLSTTQSDADGNDGETTRDIKQKSSATAEITRVGGYCADVQGYSRSQIAVSTESPHATSYQ